MSVSTVSLTKEHYLNTLSGIWFVMLFAMAALYLAQMPLFQRLEISPLIIAIVLGMLYSNVLKNKFPEEWTVGITFSAKIILRLAIVLYGFKLTFQQLLAVGTAGLVVSVIMVISTFFIGTWAAIKWFKLDQQTAFLTAAGASICGAAAVLATEPVVKAEPHKSAIAVSTVVLFGTISMFLYPFLYHNGLLANMDLRAYGIYVGATIHEVAHVVGAGISCGMEACHNSVIVKMARVILLAPFLLALGWYLSRHSGDNRHTQWVIPWFAVGFIAVTAVNSLQLLPQYVVATINDIDAFMLTMAMAALGLGTQFSKFKQVGMKPIYVALIMFLWLLVGGYAVTMSITAVM